MAITLTVEDGTGLANANSYVSQADADTYFANRANTVWAAADNDAKAAALIQATQYLDTRYAFKGERLTTTQALAWPRQQSPIRVPVGIWTDVYAGTDSQFQWPVKRVKDATCEAALRALAGPLYADQAATVKDSVKVGPITVQKSRERNGGQVRIAIIDDLLRPLLGADRHSIPLVRA